MKGRRKFRKSGTGRRNIFFISIIMALNLVGVGYGSWVDNLTIDNTISTGFIDPVFISCEAIPVSNNLSGQSTITPDVSLKIADKDGRPANEGNYLIVDIKNAYPGYSIDINYTIINHGTVPVSCQCTLASNSSPLIEVRHTAVINIINGNDSRKKSTIRITIKDGVKESLQYNAELKLLFKQYNDIR